MYFEGTYVKKKSPHLEHHLPIHFRQATRLAMPLALNPSFGIKNVPKVRLKSRVLAKCL